MKQGFSGALAGGAAQQQPVNPAQAPQALQQLTQVLHMVSAIHNEKTYQMAKQQFAQAGGDPSKLSKNYNKTEITNLKKLLIKGLNHLAGTQQAQQPQQPPAAAAPQPQQQSATPPPQEY